MTKKETIEFLKERNIENIDQLLDLVYAEPKKDFYIFINTSTNDYKVFTCNDWELETQDKYFKLRKKCFNSDYKTEVFFSKRKLKSVITYN